MTDTIQERLRDRSTYGDALAEEAADEIDRLSQTVRTLKESLTELDKELVTWKSAHQTLEAMHNRTMRVGNQHSDARDKRIDLLERELAEKDKRIAELEERLYESEENVCALLEEALPPSGGHDFDSLYPPNDDDQLLNPAGARREIVGLRDKLAARDERIKEAEELINYAALEIMTTDQLGRWAGVRAWVEDVGADDD